MTDEREGTLQMTTSRRWAICRPGRLPVEITSGELFRIAVPGRTDLQPTRMEFRHLSSGGGEYYSVDGYELRSGMRFDVDRVSPADVDRWDELKRHVVRMKEGLELALGELVSGAPTNDYDEATGNKHPDINAEYGRQVAKLTAASWRAQAD